VHDEGELVIVIGRPAWRVTPEAAPAFILGYTCSNDIRGEGSWSPDISNWRKKGSDTFRFHGHQVPLDDSCTNPPVTRKKRRTRAIGDHKTSNSKQRL
jgi:2-keto-4-pentenoate hydratase/2-oxohepta-3-ene-1,7-dioic acid hydratase in catechol pathway